LKSLILTRCFVQNLCKSFTFRFNKGLHLLSCSFARLSPTPDKQILKSRRHMIMTTLLNILEDLLHFRILG